MGLLDGLFGMFGSMGATVTRNITQQQPTSPSGATYTTGGTTVTSQPATPIQVQPQSPFSDPVGWLGGAAGYVGGGIQYAGQQIQNIAAPIAPVAPIAMAAPFLAAPLVVGSMAVSGVQGMLAPRPQPVTAPTLGNGASYTPMIVSAPVVSPTTFFVSAGAKGQIPVVGKMTYGVGGDYLIYDVPRGHYITNIASGGSAGALQSGTVTLRPATPVIYNRESGMGSINTQYGNVKLAAAVLANPNAYSDVGAEAYGGMVMPLDRRTLESSGAVMGKYPVASGNLANIVDPYILNQPKQNWAMDLPWSMKNYSTAPVIQSVDMQGRMAGISPLGMGSIGMVAAPVSVPIREGSPLVGLPAPFRSIYGGYGTRIEAPTGTVTPPSQKDAWKLQSPIGGLIGLSIWGDKKDAVLSGFAGSVIDFTTGLVGWTPVKDRTQAVDPILASWRTENERMKATTHPEEYNLFLQKSFEKGILTKPITSPTFVENPNLTYDYGEWSKWSIGAGNVVKEKLGFSQAQLDTYQYNVEQKKGIGTIPEKIVFGTGYTFSTQPGKIATAFGAGAVMVLGGEIVGGMYSGSALATRAGAFALVHPTTAAIGSGIIRYGIPTALAGATYYGASEEFTATPERTTVNLGKMFPELVGVTWGGASAYAGVRATDRGYFGFQTKKEVYLPGWEKQTVEKGFGKLITPTPKRMITVDAQGNPIISVVGQEPINVPTVRQIGEGMIFPRKSELNLATPRPKTILDFRPQEPDMGMFSSPDVRNIGDVIYRPETSTGFTNIGTKRFTTENFALNIPDVAPVPTDLMPGVRFQAGRSGEMLPMTPQEAAFGLQIRTEPVFAPKGIGMPSGASQIMANPEILSGTRAGSTVTSIDTLMQKQMQFSAYKKTGAQQRIADIIPRTVVQEPSKLGDFGDILRGIQESERRIPSSSLWKPVEAKDMGFGEFGPAKAGLIPQERVIKTTIGVVQLSPTRSDFALNNYRQTSGVMQGIIQTTDQFDFTVQKRSPVSAVQQTSNQLQSPLVGTINIASTKQHQQVIQQNGLIQVPLQNQRISTISQQTPKQKPEMKQDKWAILSPVVGVLVPTLPIISTISDTQKPTKPGKQKPERPYVPYFDYPWIPVPTEPKTPVPLKPIIPVIPGGALLALPFTSGLRDYPQRRERGAYGFKEVSPTWTPGQMGRALFTGKFTRTATSRDNLPKGMGATKRQYRETVPQLPKMPKVSKRGRKNILKGR